MFGLIFAPFLLILSLIFALIKPLLSLLKVTGFWIVALYIFIMTTLQFIFHFTGDEKVTDYLNLGLTTSNDYAIFGLKAMIVISVLWLIFRITRFAFRAFAR